MRTNRSTQLFPESASVHLMWSCHDKKYYLRPANAKALYMQTIHESFKKNPNVQIYSYCVMDNHYHQSTRYESSSQSLSTHMRYSHSLFGSRYNRIHDRSGKVAVGRPKTSLIENEEHEMRVHFYIEANPIRAKMCTPENLRTYKYNSFKFYAYGIKDEHTSLLTMPSWYLELGDTAKERQRKYRRLFYEYLGEQERPDWDFRKFECLFIGSQIWKQRQLKRISVKPLENTG